MTDSIGYDPSLDIHYQNPTDPKEWTSQQKRVFHRVKSLLTFWGAFGYQVLWVCLTSAPDSDPKKLAYHHQILRQRVERELGYEGLEHITIRTSEGNGVLHVFWAWKPKNGRRHRSFYVGQRWLSRNWAEIHGAPIVWVCRANLGNGGKRKMARYCATQYCAGQSKLERLSWSWKRGLGGALVKTWRKMLEIYDWNLNAVIPKWEALLSGVGFDVGSVRFKPPPSLGYVELCQDWLTRYTATGGT